MAQELDLAIREMRVILQLGVFVFQAGLLQHAHLERELDPVMRNKGIRQLRILSFPAGTFQQAPRLGLELGLDLLILTLTIIL
jgi:hypothetical protein